MKKLTIVTLLLFAGLFLATGNAQAVPTSISIDGIWSWGTVYGLSGSTWNALTSNPYYSTTSQNLTNGVAALADGTEDSYGIMRISSIAQGSTVLFDAASSSFELTILYYGFDDIYLNAGTGPYSRLLATGGHAAVYQDFAKNYNRFAPPGPGAAPGGGRSDSDATPPDLGDAFQYITDGTKVLDLTPTLRWDGTAGANYTMENFFSFSSLTGSGNILFDVTGGTWQSIFDTNTQVGGSDIVLDFSSQNATGSPWTVKGSGEAVGDADIIPEPATMAIFGMGLLGMGTLTRRKRKV